jgi:hypothetical protein
VNFKADLEEASIFKEKSSSWYTVKDLKAMGVDPTKYDGDEMTFLGRKELLKTAVAGVTTYDHSVAASPEVRAPVISAVPAEVVRRLGLEGDSVAENYRARTYNVENQAMFLYKDQTRPKGGVLGKFDGFCITARMDYDQLGDIARFETDGEASILRGVCGGAAPCFEELGRSLPLDGIW